MGDLRQPHPEALLIFPIEIPANQALTFDVVTTSLYRQLALAPTVPFKWGFIDRPKDGEIFLIHHRGGAMTDGLMYLEQEHRYMVPKQGHGPEIECFEARQGFIPGQDNQASRIRRRFHFVRPPGNPQLFLIHYSRAPAPVHVAAHLHQQIRSYPLPPLPPMNVFIAGPRAGEIIHDDEARQIVAAVQSRAPEAFNTQPRGLQGSLHGANPAYAPGFSQEISAQNARLRELERKKQMMASAARREDEDSPDEDSAVSVRTLALSRYRRNHELMEEVFQRAAFGSRKPEHSSDSSIPVLTQDDINAKLAATLADVEALEKKAAERQRIRDEREQAVEAMVS